MVSVLLRRKSLSSQSTMRPEPQLIVKRSGLQHLRPPEAMGGEVVLLSATTGSLPTAESKRWKNYHTRCLWGAIMIILYALLLMAGPAAVILLVVVVQTAVFREVVGIAHTRYREHKLAWFRTINWFFLLSAYYYLFGESLIQIFRDSVFADAFMMPLATHHRFISYCLYMFGLILFVLNLKKGHYKFQFNQFGLCHMTILLVVCQAQFVLHNTLNGLFWFVFPAMLVVWNDIMAYFFGFFFGRTPLIKLSPKKTWEGFLGGFFATVIFGVFLCALLSRYQYFTCPVSDLRQNIFSGVACKVDPVFLPHVYRLPVFLSGLARLLFGIRVRELYLRPIQLHSLAFSIFASLIAPFGGFFASGFKRAFKVKDFSDSIPGHGGMTDRMDCQFLMGLFVYLYFSSFIKLQPMTAGQLLEMAVSKLSPPEQRLLFVKLREYLIGQDLLSDDQGFH